MQSFLLLIPSSVPADLKSVETLIRITHGWKRVSKNDNTNAVNQTEGFKMDTITPSNETYKQMLAGMLSTSTKEQQENKLASAIAYLIKRIEETK